MGVVPRRSSIASVPVRLVHERVRGERHGGEGCDAGLGVAVVHGLLVVHGGCDAEGWWAVIDRLRRHQGLRVHRVGDGDPVGRACGGDDDAACRTGVERHD